MRAYPDCALFADIEEIKIIAAYAFGIVGNVLVCCKVVCFSVIPDKTVTLTGKPENILVVLEYAEQMRKCFPVIIRFVTREGFGFLVEFINTVVGCGKPQEISVPGVFHHVPRLN